jgi:hypothetical protein
MQLLEDCYNEIILNERLKVLNINPNIIKNELNKQYKEYQQREKKTGYKIAKEKEGWYQPQENEEIIIKQVLSLMPYFDDVYKNIIEKYKTDFSGLKKAFVLTDRKWQNAINTMVPKSFLQKQPANLTLINFLNNMMSSDVRIPIKYTEAGFPVYPYHMINKFLAMNILEEMYTKKQIDNTLKKQIENIIFDEETKKVIGKEVDEYMQRTSKSVEEPE